MKRILSIWYILKYVLGLCHEGGKHQWEAEDLGEWRCKKCENWR